MPLRVFCPDCHAPRTAPGPGARVRCRNCDRVFRAGTRAERRPWRDEDDDPPETSGGGAQKLMLVLAGVAVLVFGLAIGGGLGAWWMLNRPAREPADDDVIEVDEPQEMPPPAVGPGPIGPPRPVNPGPVGNPADGPE